LKNQPPHKKALKVILGIAFAIFALIMFVVIISIALKMSLPK